ncbi:hypothetical protein BH23CHL5_BH23CHL5_25640 [soil metagenome]
MKTCPNCGWSNDEQNRFCENCGADFVGLEAEGRVPQSPDSTWAASPRRESDVDEPRSAQNRWDVRPTEPDWRMAPLPSDDSVKPRGRRLWLWFLIAIFSLCLISCAGGFIWLGYTDSGQNFQTSVADRETETAEN